MRPNSEADFLAGIEILIPFFESQDFQLRVYPPFQAEEGTFYFAQFVDMYARPSAKRTGCS